ncbi:MAG: hypothetical protein ACXACY_21490 [Candidatus Hodarchaeales archaeon]|jgi:hypothetical protein
MTLYQVGEQFINETGSSTYQVGSSYIVETVQGLEQSVATGLNFTQLAKLQTRPADSSDTITFSQTAVPVISILVQQTVTFSQVISTLPTINETLSQTITFSQTAVSSLKTLNIAQTITFSHLANNEQSLSLSESQTITFTQNTAIIGPITEEQTITFTQAAGAGLIIPGGIERTALPGTITFSQAVQKVLILAGATALTGTAGTITFSQATSLLDPIVVQMQQPVIFTQLAVSDYVTVVSQTLTFTQLEADPSGTIWTRTLTQGLNFSHAMAYLNQIDICGYSPAIGASTDPTAPSPPPASLTVTKESSITLSYPTTSPTTTVTIRAPEYGERHRLSFDRINRESRGGELQIFSDPDWPKLEILVASFTGLTEAEAQSVLDFFQTTLGLEVKLVDWYGKTWHGVVVTPEAQLIRARRGIVDLSFEFEGEVQ